MAGVSILFVELIQKFDHIIVQLPLVGVGKFMVGWKFIELLDRMTLLFKKFIMFPRVWLLLLVLDALLIEFPVVAKLIGRQSSHLIFQILKNIVERSRLLVHVYVAAESVNDILTGDTQ